MPALPRRKREPHHGPKYAMIPASVMDVFDDPTLGDVADEDRAFYLLLWVFCDDWGRFFVRRLPHACNIDASYCRARLAVLQGHGLVKLFQAPVRGVGPVNTGEINGYLEFKGHPKWRTDPSLRRPSIIDHPPQDEV